MIYKLKLPIKVSFIIDDNDLQIRNLDDIDYLEEKYDVDLQYIIDEYEYKLEAEESYLDEDEDSFGINKIDILQSVIDDNIKSISENINKEIELSKLKNEDLTRLFAATQDDFNGRISLNSHDGDYNIKSIQINSYDVSNSVFIIDVDVDKELSKSELYHLKSTIDHKCIEDWGTEFESIDHSDVIDNEMYVYLKCWDENNQIDFI
jgi:hypothetical protein